MSTTRYIRNPAPITVDKLKDEKGRPQVVELFTVLDWLSAEPTFRQPGNDRIILEVLSRFESPAPSEPLQEGLVVELPEPHWTLICTVWRSVDISGAPGTLRPELRRPFMTLMCAITEAKDTADGEPPKVGKAARAIERAVNGRKAQA